MFRRVVHAPYLFMISLDRHMGRWDAAARGPWIERKRQAKHIKGDF